MQTISVPGFTFTVPALDIDKRLGHPHARGRCERRIVAALIQHLDARGFVVSSVFDGEEVHVVDDAKATAALGTLIGRTQAAMEWVFNLDEASLRFRHRSIDREADEKTRDGPRGWTDAEHGVLVVLGNGEDCIADWNYTEGDPDGFDKAMDAFIDEPEDGPSLLQRVA